MVCKRLDYFHEAEESERYEVEQYNLEERQIEG